MYWKAKVTSGSSVPADKSKSKAGKIQGPRYKTTGKTTGTMEGTWENIQ